MATITSPFTPYTERLRQQADLILQYQRTRSDATFAALADDCCRLVWSCVHRRMRASPWARRNQDEIHEAGLRGLWLAVVRFKPDRGDFTPFARKCIAGTIGGRIGQERWHWSNQSLDAEPSDAMPRLAVSLPSRREPDPTSGMIAADLWAQVEASCTAQQAQALHSCYYLGLSVAETAGSMSVTGQRVYQLLAAGLVRMRAALQADGGW